MRRFLFALTFVLAVVSYTSAAGIRTTFVKVTLDNLRIGNEYNIREMANLPLAVYNTGDQAIDLKVEPTVPLLDELREGYEPIPDVSWILIKQDSFKAVKPDGVAITDVVISIPDAHEHLGKKYQAMVWSHTVGAGLIACGLKSEILFSISRTEAGAKEDLHVFPTEVFVSDVKAGKVFDVKKKGGGVTLKVFNRSGENKEFEIESIRVADSPLELKEGYIDCPDPGFLVLSDAAFTLREDEDKEIAMRLAFPENELYAGKRYMFAVHTRVVGEPESGVYSKIYASLEE
jgi:hypothetical protein